MNPYVALGAAIILAISHGWAFVKGRGWERGAWETKVAEQSAKARDLEQHWQGAYNELSKTYLARIRQGDERLRTALDSLRDRPGRPLPGDPGVPCVGATGAELSKQDGEFLAWEAARAERLRESYGICLRALNALRESASTHGQ